MRSRVVEAIAGFQDAVATDTDSQEALTRLIYSLRDKQLIEERIERTRSQLDAFNQGINEEEMLRGRNELARCYYMLSRDEEACAEWVWVANHGTGNPQRSAKKMLHKYYNIIG